MPRPTEPPTRSEFRVPILIERLPSGRVRFSSPAVPDWQRAAQGAHQIARAVTDLLQAAFTEAQIREYRARRKAITDSTFADRRAATGEYQRFIQDGKIVRRVGHNPHSWTEQADGTWRSPSGRTYVATSQVVQRVKARQLTGAAPPPRPRTSRTA